jgi:hypothetical protein
MLAVLILVLIGGVLVSMALCFAIFIQVAFGPTVLPVRKDAGLVGLPILTGGNLHDWGKQLALDIASKEANRKRSGNAAVAMASEVESAISKVVARMSSACRQVDHKICSSCRCDVIPLTAPEALAIAEDLRQRCSARTIESIRARARRNLQSNVRAPGQEVPTASDGICPLYGVDDGCCLAHAARPVYCRGRDVVSNVSSTIASPAAERVEDSFAANLGEGMLVGLASALGEAHYEQHIYELNSALAAALEDPDASRHWVDNEAVFAGCATIDSLIS